MPSNSYIYVIAGESTMLPPDTINFNNRFLHAGEVSSTGFKVIEASVLVITLTSSETSALREE
jgi:hypothetical protein